MRVVLIDDERLARAELRRLLAAHPEVEIVGEAVNAADGVQQIAALKPDLVFLDVQMPGGSGFDMLAALEEPPSIPACAEASTHNAAKRPPCAPPGSVFADNPAR